MIGCSQFSLTKIKGPKPVRYVSRSVPGIFTLAVLQSFRPVVTNLNQNIAHLIFLKRS